MTEQGIVKKIEGQLVWISAQQCGGCDHEAHCGSCGSGRTGIEIADAEPGHPAHHGHAIFGTGRERTFAVRNSQSFQVSIGDRVEYFVAPAKAIKAGFFVLIAPILIFFLFYFLTGLLWPDAGETAKVLAGVGGIAAGFALNFALKSKIREYPEITRIIPRINSTKL